MRIIVFVLLIACSAAFANPPHNRPPDNRPPDRGGDADVQVQTDSNVDITSTTDVTVANDPSASVTGVAGGEGGKSTNTVNTSSESRSIYLGAARDTAACFTKVTIGADVFGLGFSRSDPYCKKIRLVVRHLDSGNYEAAARLECTLREWRDVFGKDSQACFESLLIEQPEPEPAAVAVAQVDEEEFDRLREVVLMQASELEVLREQVEQTEHEETELDEIRQQQTEDEARREMVRQRMLEKRAAENEDGS